MLVLAAFAITLQAQTTGRLAGSVIDQSGAAIPNANVSLFLPGGDSAVITAQTTTDGLFHLTSLRPESYILTVESPGFNKYRLTGVKIDSAAETSLPPIKLEVAAAAQSVEVNANVASVDTNTIEVSKTISKNQIEDLPAPDRQVSTLFLTQAGVTESRGAAVVNGMRTSAANVTYDGINIQDNYIRNNSLDFIPNKLTIDQVQEVTVNTSNANPALGGGAAQIVLISPSGTNEFRGSVYWYNRNNAFSATDWFDNQSGAGKQFLNLNQLGGSIGGPILRNKLLFYANYEAFRQRTSTYFNNTILLPDARQGVFTYRTSSGAIQKFNLLQAAGLSIDPVIQGQLSKMPSAGNNTNVGDGLNTTGYALNAPENEDRDTVTGKLDYYLSTKNVFSGSFTWNRDNVLRPDVLQSYGTGYYGGSVPITNANKGKLMSASWRWTPTGSLTNELRGGFNLASLPFNVSGEEPSNFITGTLFTTPVNQFLPQGRDTKIFSLQDNATWMHGKHTIFFGYQEQILHLTPYNAAGIVPSYGLGISANSPYATVTSQIPGLRSTDVATANSLLTSLGGIISSYTQTYNVSSQTSGFVSGAEALHHNVLNTYSGYIADSYKMFRNLTWSIGLRYDYWTPVYDADGLYLSPQIQNNNPAATILNPAGVLNFIGDKDHPFYHPSKKNFSPNAGFAWDVLGNGKTSVRGGYSLAYINDETILTVIDGVSPNAGLSSAVTSSSQAALISSGLPKIPTPTFKVPRTFADNWALSTSNGESIIDPNLKTPYIQQWNFGVEQQVKNVVFDVRYVGNHGTKLYQTFDQNQVQINASGFLQDFIRARNNGFLAQAAGLGFKPAYNSAVAGSQPLTVFPTMPNGGYLTNSSVLTYLQRGEVGTLGQFYVQNGVNGPVQFFQNPNELLGRVLTNFANSTYNALQTEARGHFSKDLQFQFSYVYGKVMSNSNGTNQTQGNVEDLLAVNNGKIPRARAPFDLTHVFKANYVYQVPLGKGHRFMSGRLMDAVVGGWTTSAIWTYQSGSPFSVLFPYGTYNRAARSPYETANTTQTRDSLSNLVGNQVYMTGNGPYFISPSLIGSDGRGIAPFGSAPFSGQAFFAPDPGTIGSMQLRQFSGPWDFSFDASAQKTFHITEKQQLRFRADFYNLFNHPVFLPSSDSTNANINATTFGKMAVGTLNGPRVIQFGLYYRF